MNSLSFLPRRQPFFYLTMAFISGIVVEKFFAPARSLMIVLLVLSALISIFTIFRKKALSATLALLVGFLAIGALLARAESQQIEDSRLSKLFESGSINSAEPVELTGILLAPPEPAPDARFFDIEAESIRTINTSVAATGRARLIVAFTEQQSLVDYQQLNLDYGTRLRVLVRLEHARSYKNPGSVDFNDFLEQQGYDLKGTIKSPLLIESLEQVPVNPILARLYRFRLRMLDAIDGRFRQPVAGTLKAMIFGNKYFLDADTGERLRQSSTFHTLVISGMHVSLVAFALLAFPVPQFRREEKSRLGVAVTVTPRLTDKGNRRPGRLRTFLAFVVLWGYTLMVGLAPPVTRAAVMISIGLLAPLLFRQAVSLNTVALAAFLMIALKPAIVADPGFQLSFIAVLAIVVIALPLAHKLQSIGEWRPAPGMAHPPGCSRRLRVLAEILYWDERAFHKEMRQSPITYGLDKSPLARTLNFLRLQWLVRNMVLLFITSMVIQFLTLPLMSAYFNRVAPVGILLNIFAGLLTGIITLAAIFALVVGAMNAAFAVPFVWMVKVSHYLLVHSIDPFSGIAGMTFRVAHYDGWQAIIYALYFVPIAALVVLMDNWQPLKTDRQESTSNRRQAQNIAGQTDGETERTQQSYLGLAQVKPLMIYGLLLVFLLSTVAVMTPPVRVPKSKLTVYFLDVGQGDAALVVFPQGSTMLIDGGGEAGFKRQKASQEGKRQKAKGKRQKGEEVKGSADSLNAPSQSPQDDAEQRAGFGEVNVVGSNPQGGLAAESEEETGLNPQGGSADGAEEEAGFKEPRFSVGESVVSRFLWSLGLTRIDYVLATHADADHMDGLAAVAENFNINQAIVGRVVMHNFQFDAFAGATAKQQAPLMMVNAGERFEIEGVTIETLWPLPSGQAAAKSSNDDSIVLRLSYGGNAILMTGDIERESEESLVQSGVNLRADVLKIPHHGSKTSSTEAFLDAVKPRLAIISVGERSRFGHPHAVVVERYQKRGVNLLQTGRDGMICVQSDGVTLEVSRQSKQNPGNF
jgi:ComEC/Rec2-related protein